MNTFLFKNSLLRQVPFSLKFLRWNFRILFQLTISFISLTAAYPSEKEEISLIAVGDITIGSELTPILKKSGVDIVFSEVSNLLQSADISVATLNTSISDRGEPKYGLNHKAFRAIPDLAGSISKAGFDLMSLTTPHLLDFGTEALEDTIQLLNNSHVKTIGAGLTEEDANKPAWFNVKTAQVAFLAYSHGRFFATQGDGFISRALHSSMIEKVKKLSKRADLLIVMTHWGKPRQTTEVTKRQQFFAHALVDAGADLVLCQRLHMLQGTEIYQGKPIVYSLADFVYDNYDKQYTRIISPKITFCNGELKLIELIPVWVGNPKAKYQPQILNGELAKLALENYQFLCKELNTEVIIESNKGFIYPRPPKNHSQQDAFGIGDYVEKNRGNKPEKVVYLLDISSSMNRQNKLQLAVSAIKDAINMLKPDDQFNLITFDSKIDLYSKSTLAATPENISAACKFLDQLQHGSGTNLSTAIENGLKLTPSTLVVVSDGTPSRGIRNPEKIWEMVHRWNISQTRIMTIALGNDHSNNNVKLLQQLASDHNGKMVSINIK